MDTNLLFLLIGIIVPLPDSTFFYEYNKLFARKMVRVQQYFLTLKNERTSNLVIVKNLLLYSYLESTNTVGIRLVQCLHFIPL